MRRLGAHPSGEAGEGGQESDFMGHRTRGLLGSTAVLVALVLVAAGCWSPPPAPDPASFSSHLTRAPYLTDAVGLHVLVNWATDQTGNAGSVRWGPFDQNSGTCNLANTQSATRQTVIVGTVHEYQWKAPLTLPATGPYCYRVLLDTTDLLGSADALQFQTNVQPGATDSFKFAVFGDWGQTDANGDNPDTANLLKQVRGSGARFAVTTGDNGYPNGNQQNYGDLQQKAADTSAIFGPSFWTVPGTSIPLFATAGNHGLSTNAGAHTDLVNWPQDVAVASSGGRYTGDTYCCVNGTSPADYTSSWFAFDAGNARFYMLDSAWGDTNPGTATPYADDAAAHFAPGDPEYQWLLHDLQTHPTGLKFAFSHFPVYSDNNTQPSDTFLQGPANLEGLLTQYGVNVWFNGHAHIYERNVPSTAGAPVTYVTGGGGGTLEPMGTCHSYDAYAIGWSNSSSKGSKCGTAVAPTAITQVFHFLNVNVSGTSVTVSPTDEFGNTFDVQTYDFSSTAPNTVIDAAPALQSNSPNAAFMFHSTATPATFACRIDGAASTACTSPASYSGLVDGTHTFSVAATVNGVTDPTPATYTWTVDTSPPSTPAPTATPASPTSVNVTWPAASDNVGVSAYDVTRNGAALTTVAGTTTSFTDNTAAPNTNYTYAVRARDAAGNQSAFGAAAPVTTPPPPTPVFADGFESGNASAWTSAVGLTVETSTVHSGTWAAEGNTTNGATYAKKTLPGTYTDAYARVYFDIKSFTDQVNLLRLRDAAGNSLGYLFVNTSGALAFHDDVTALSTTSTTTVGPGWHALELHMLVNGTTSTVGAWLDDVPVSALSSNAANLGTAPVGQLQIGEVQTGRTYDVVFDDAVFATQRIGL
jgi:hypothetical protein